MHVAHSNVFESATADLEVRCPCESWCLTVPIGTGSADADFVRAALDEHMRTCIVLTACVIAAG